MSRIFPPLGRRTFLKGAVVVTLGLPLAGCLGYDGDVQHGYQIDERLLAQVRPGSSAEQVLVVMGTPTTTSTVGGDAWYYIQQRTQQSLAFMARSITEQRVLAVYFDKGKKVDRIANYGLEDGKVVDSVSRSTPTGGKEQSFLNNVLNNFMRF